MNETTVVVSLSGGKDSTATALVALELHGRERCRFVFADTGNEHQATYEYALDYLPRALGITVDVVRADFTDGFVTKRANLTRLAAGEPETSVYGRRGFAYHWTPEAAARALDLLHPTGNPFLDLCMVRGGFPSRKRQYCTEVLKRDPITEYQISIVDAGYQVESWQGVRIAESPSRRNRLQGTGACVRAYEYLGGGMSVYRPILRWSVADVFEAHRLAGVDANPLDRQGQSRVGCMPCINSSKADIRSIALRFPAEIERVAEWERLVTQVTRPRGPVSFFHMGTQNYDPDGPPPISKAVEWAKTTRGGRQFDLLAQLEEPTACSSAYGLCE